MYIVMFDTNLRRGYVRFKQEAVGYEERGRYESHQAGRIVEGERVQHIVHYIRVI
jgi:hypothetical protein